MSGPGTLAVTAYESMSTELGIILEPHLDRRGGRKLLQRLGDSGGEVFLNVAIACASCAGCRGRALMCE